MRIGNILGYMLWLKLQATFRPGPRNKMGSVPKCNVVAHLCDGYTSLMKVIGTFCNCVNVPKKY
jgi:hypothetical protein